MSGKSAPRKGKEFEREVVNKARDWGLESERARGSDGRSLGMAQTTDVLIARRAFQCKRVKTLAKKYVPTDDEYGQIFRGDRGETYVLVRFEDYLTDLAALHGVFDVDSKNDG